MSFNILVILIYPCIYRGTRSYGGKHRNDRIIAFQLLNVIFFAASTCHGSTPLCKNRHHSSLSFSRETKELSDTITVWSVQYFQKQPLCFWNHFVVLKGVIFSLRFSSPNNSKKDLTFSDTFLQPYVIKAFNLSLFVSK